MKLSTPADRIGKPLPPRWKTAVASWLAVYPTITLVGWLSLPVTADMPWPLRTLAITLVMVPLVVYVVGPLVQRLLEKVVPGWH